MPSIRKRVKPIKPDCESMARESEKSFASLKSAERWVESKTTKDNPKSLEITSQKPPKCDLLRSCVNMRKSTHL